MILDIDIQHICSTWQVESGIIQAGCSNSSHRLQLYTCRRKIGSCYRIYVQYVHIYIYIYIYVFATFSFDTVFRVNASLFNVTSFKGVSSFAVIIALVLPVWGSQSKKFASIWSCVCGIVYFNCNSFSQKPTQIAENLRPSKIIIAWMLLYTSWQLQCGLTRNSDHFG